MSAQSPVTTRGAPPPVRPPPDVSQWSFDIGTVGAVISSLARTRLCRSSRRAARIATVLAATSALLLLAAGSATTARIETAPRFRPRVRDHRENTDYPHLDSTKSSRSARALAPEPPAANRCINPPPDLLRHQRVGDHAPRAKLQRGPTDLREAPAFAHEEDARASAGGR
jgi:hypothetical protein